MSDPGAELWRFVEPHSKSSHYQDDIVYHTLTEHRAIRRVFSERVAADPVAVKAIKRQITEASAATPPVLPFNYMLFEEDGALALVFEYVAGKPLQVCIQDRSYKKTVDWARAATRLTEALLDLREQKIRFEKITAGQIVLTEQGTMRLNTRCPVGQPESEELESSQVLSRMHRQAESGVYAGGIPNERAEMGVLSDILLKMYAGEHSDFITFCDDVNKRQQKGVEISGAAIILKDLFDGPGGKGTLTSLDTLRERLSALVSSEREKEQSGEPSQPSQTAYPRTAPPSQPTAPAPSPASSAENPFAAPSPSASNPAPAPDPASNPYATPEPKPPSSSGEKKRLTKPKEQLHRPEGFPSFNPDQASANPYAAETGPAPEGGAGSRASRSSSSVIGRPVDAKKNNTMMIIIIAVAVIAVGGGGYFAMGMLGGGGNGATVGAPNQRPVAQITPLESTSIQLNEVLPISAAESSDPEGEPLRYNWRVVSPEGAEIIFTDINDTDGTRTNLYITDANGITVQFTERGSYTLELTVRDGMMGSEKQSITINAGQ